jgi:mono/diheme cytochrome c family protein
MFWQPGIMPIQLLMTLGVIFLFFVIGHTFIKKTFGKGIPMLGQGALVMLVAYITFKYVITPPIPFSLLVTYMGLVGIVVALYISATEAQWTETKRPIINTLIGATPTYRGARVVAFIAIPLFMGWQTYTSIAPPKEFPEPPELRTVHPAPPQAIKVHDKNFNLQTSQNPFRVDTKGEYLEVGKEQAFFDSNPWDPKAEGYLKYVREGGAVFFRNCHFCHGDNLDGRGIFAYAWRPIPANLADPGTIAQLQETFVFWRISKGGMNAPREINPWDSAMPPWEEHLTTEDIWRVALFEYWHTGFFPRTWD